MHFSSLQAVNTMIDIVGSVHGFANPAGRFCGLLTLFNAFEANYHIVYGFVSIIPVTSRVTTRFFLHRCLVGPMEIHLGPS